jgi:tRNA (guanine37-N1)-methyltransferase
MPKNLCVSVERAAAESVRRSLLRLKLFDNARKIKTVAGTVLIPISHRPKPDELTTLRDIGRVKIISADLRSASAHPKDLVDVLDGKLPPHLLAQLPRSYDIVGDIAVLEFLSPDLKAHKKEIGKALMDLHPNVRTVLLKTGKVKGEFRVPQLAVLAGRKRFDTIHTEYGMKFKVDLSKVYFSPRLGSEHHRVASLVSDGETVLDMFAGVGPFSLMIAKYSKAKVCAVDLNPDAIRLLSENIGLNKLRGGVIPICDDARRVSGQLSGKADRIIMNLPASSLNFLNVASECLKSEGGIIHIYIFVTDEPLVKAESAFREAAERVFSHFEIRGMHIVKPVAPKEWQVALDVWALK